MSGYQPGRCGAQRCPSDKPVVECQEISVRVGAYQIVDPINELIRQKLCWDSGGDAENGFAMKLLKNAGPVRDNDVGGHVARRTGSTQTRTLM